MTVQSLLAQGYDTLSPASIDTPRLDALLLLAHALATTKERLLASLPDPVDAGAAGRYRGLLERRLSGIPVSYIRGVKEFYGLEFHVDARVLVPRPDTEALVERALEIAREEPWIRRVLDACTGSGCIGIAVKHAVPALDVSLSDVSPDALAVAAENARRILGVPLPAFLSDLLEGAQGRFDLITANPPYLSDAEADGMAARSWPEPSLALRGGPDGTALAERLIAQAPDRLSDGGWLLVEAAPGQFGKLCACMERAGFGGVTVVRDLGDRERVIVGRCGSSAQAAARA
jgi:release factor glutamine methyltransferase